MSVAKLLEDNFPLKDTRDVLIAANYWAWRAIEPKPQEKVVASRVAERWGIESLSRVRAIAKGHKAAAETWAAKSVHGWQALVPCIDHYLEKIEAPRHKSRAK